MPEADPADGLHVERQRDGSLRARGPVADGQPDGYWAWFASTAPGCGRGTSAPAARSVGGWTTYDRTGAVHEATDKS